jgi:hypothetical protein
MSQLGGRSPPQEPCMPDNDWVGERVQRTGALGQVFISPGCHAGLCIDLHLYVSTGRPTFGRKGRSNRWHARGLRGYPAGARSPRLLRGGMEVRMRRSGGVLQGLRADVDRVASTARKYRNRYGSGGTRIHAPGCLPAGMDAGGRGACCLQPRGQRFESP